MITTKPEYKILVIEDNPGDFVLIDDFLHEKIDSVNVTHAENFKDAKSILLLRGCEFDSVLLDLSLPDKKGEQLIREMLEVCPDIPVIVLTGYADFEFSIKSLSLGISDYLLKEELTSVSLYKSIIYSSERIKGIYALKESEKRYSDLFHLSPLPMWVVDMESLNYLDANITAIKNYGYSLDEFLSMTVKDIRPVEEIPALEDALLKLKTNQEVSFLGIYKHRKKNGDIIYVEIQGSSIFFQGKKARIILANDITQRLDHIKAIELQNQKLKDIAWMQSHVVRAPLARIMGFIHLMRDFEHNEVEKEEIFAHILTSALELDGVIKNISDQSGNVEY